MYAKLDYLLTYFYRAWLIAFEVGKITLTPVVASHLKSSLLVSVVWEITI